MLGDILTGYQQGGADYVHAVLTGFADAPKDMQMAEGRYYNKAFPGHQIGMPPPLSDGVVTYSDGTPGKVENYADDVVAFLSWAGDPNLDQRKRIGWQVILYLIVTTALLYLGKKRVWSAIKH
jgi:cytochrome c1